MYTEFLPDLFWESRNFFSAVGFVFRSLENHIMLPLFDVDRIAAFSFVSISELFSVFEVFQIVWDFMTCLFYFFVCESFWNS